MRTKYSTALAALGLVLGGTAQAGVKVIHEVQLVDTSAKTTLKCSVDSSYVPVKPAHWSENTPETMPDGKKLPSSVFPGQTAPASACSDVVVCNMTLTCTRAGESNSVPATLQATCDPGSCKPGDSASVTACLNQFQTQAYSTDTISKGVVSPEPRYAPAAPDKKAN